MKVALVAFHGEVGPLVVHSCDRTSINDEGFLIVRLYLGEDGGVGM